MATREADDLALRGLSADQVAERVADGRTNDVSRRTSRSLAAIVRSNVFTRFNAILGTLSVVMLVLSPRDALFGGTILVNTAIGIVQELRAKRTLDRLSLIGQARARVRRDGVSREIDPAGIVADDLIELAPGEAIFVDGRVVGGTELEIDESLLTGESEPVFKQNDDQVLSGSFAVAGSGLYRAEQVGAQSYAARLTAQASRFDLVNSQLRDGINQLLRIIQWLIIPIAALLAVSQIAANETLPMAITGAVAGVVPMIPEGLVLLTSLAFAVGVIRLGQRQCLVQELPAIEGLARVDVVCVDKTGTLTEDRMVVRQVIPLAEGLPVTDALGAMAAADQHPNASMRAIAEEFSPPREAWRSTDVAAFSSARKWSGITFGRRGTWLLGAPDVLLGPDDPALVRAQELAGQGLRVMALAVSADSLPGSGGSRLRSKAAALLVLEQRIRPDAGETLDYFRRQGVAVKVLSGDDPRTVASVAERLALPRADHPVDARELPADADKLAEALDQASVFGRVDPAQKQSMVHALQSHGHVVAMTGDGVNDVLALKDADIGVAMGSGSDASRAVARIVLLDNRFATLPYVVAEGRRVLANIERVAHLFLTKTVYSTVLAVAIGVVGLPFPFLPRHITLVGSLTIGIPAFFLALGPSAERARPGFVPRVLRFSAPAGVLAASATFVAYLVARWRDSASLEHERTTATITLFAVATFVLVLVARPLNTLKVTLVATMVAGFVIALTVPPIQDFFALGVADLVDVVIGLGVAGLACLGISLLTRTHLR